ncbi:FAD-binding domain-containing protein [Lipomyces chichibuensis]|uniref:FAD-binding domain-containing protein n=1 Tax=Lipomyces chichibuensis TaxID=1546026 RepID=UPI003343A87C
MADYNFANMGQGRFNPDGSPRPGYLAKMYWAVIGAFLGAAFILHICDFVLGMQRKRIGNARPKFTLARLLATFTSIARVLTYPTPTFLQRYPGFVYFPSLGRMLLVLCYWCLLIGLFFYRNPINDSSKWLAASYRAAWLSIAQLPLIILLSVKRLSVISIVTGSTSSVSLNFFHRWVARGLLFTTTLHMFYTMRYYASFKFLVSELQTNIIPRRGLASWCILAWIVLVTTIRPIRHYAFELFFANHVISVIAFFIAVLKHTPSYTHVYIWIALGLYIADVALRWFLILLNNISRSGLNYRATVSVMQDQKALSIEIPMTSIRLLNWKPGQFVRLSFPTVAPFMAHPFTISSLPEDNKSLFVIRVKSGFTKRMLKKTLLIGADLEKYDDNAVKAATYPVIIDGPYGGPSRAWNQFDTVLSIVCGTGATYGVAVLRDVLRNTGTVRTLRLCWIVRNYNDIITFRDHLERILKSCEICASDLSVLIQVFVSDTSTIPSNEQSEFDGFLAQHAEFIMIIPGKPVIRDLIRDVLDRAGGETGIATCGTKTLTGAIKNDVAYFLDARGAHTGSDAQGCWVHSEQFEL